MLHIQDNKISLTRGDTAYLNVSVEIDKKPYEMQEGDTLTFSIKKSTSDKTPLVEKTISGGTRIHIEPSDTSGLEYGKYKYDVQLDKANGDVFTIIEPTAFVVLEEVTH